MHEQDNIQLSKQTVAAINAHDLEAYVKHIDPAYTGESEALGAVHGLNGARQAMSTLLAAFPDLHVEVEEMIGSGDHVIARFLLSGTHKGNFAGVAPTNQKVNWHACNIVEMKNGKAIRSRIYADNVTLMRQLGVLPAQKTTTAG